MDKSAKILLLGRSGVGKSSFINYFLGRDVAEAGYGRPVTQEYFIPYEVNDGRYPITIFDTKGLEAKEANMQVEAIISEVKRRNGSDNVMNWFHTIFYCVSMGNSRFQPYEAALIKRLQSELTQHIHIIITQCDKAAPNTIQDMKKQIASQLENLDNIEIYEVVSVTVKKRSGAVKPKGKEAVAERVFDLLLEDIAYKVSVNYAKEVHVTLCELVGTGKLEMIKFVDKYVTFKNIKKAIAENNESWLGDEMENYNIGEIMDEKIESYLEKHEEKFSKTLEAVSELYYSYQGVVTDTSFEEELNSALDDIMSDFYCLEINDEEAMSHIMPRTAKSEEILNDDFKIYKLPKVIAGIFFDLLSFNKNCKEYVNTLMDEMYNSIPSEKEIQKSVYKRIIEIFSKERCAK